jgi:ELWxxDGT repeat protein
VADRLFFIASDAEKGRELWTTNGSATLRVNDINPGAASSQPNWLTAIGDTLMFSANDGLTGSEPWIIDVNNLFQPVSVSIQRDVTNLNSNGSIAVVILSDSGFDASLVDVNTVNFAGALAYQSALEDVDNDGDLDLVVHFRVEETLLDSVYAQLIQDDLDNDGVLDSSRQEVEVSLAAALDDGTLIEGSDSFELSLRGRALRELLDELYA